MITKNGTPNPQNANDTETIPTGKLSFRDYVTAGRSLKAIVDGEYDAAITAIKFIPHAIDETKDMLRLEVTFGTDLDNRTVVENRFVSGYFIFEREIKAQLGLSDQSMPVPELFTKIVGTPIKVWYKTTKSLKDNKSYQNMYFSKPLEEAPVQAAEEIKF